MLSLAPLVPSATRARPLVLVLVAVLVPAAARADSSDVAPTEPSSSTTTSPTPSVDFEVERQATRAQRLLDRGQTQEAIAAFRRAYELRADARFLYDIAECYRRLGLVEQALHFYRSYLSVAPDAADRDEVEANIATLEHALPPRAPPAPAPLGPSLANDLIVVPIAEPGPTRTPLWRRWWAWAALGAALAGGAALAFALTRNQADVPETALGDKKFYQ